MHKVRKTLFHVVDEVGYDLLLGDDFIMENKVFNTPRSALPLRRAHKHRDACKTKLHRQHITSLLTDHQRLETPSRKRSMTAK